MKILNYLEIADSPSITERGTQILNLVKAHAILRTLEAQDAISNSTYLQHVMAMEGDSEHN